MLKTDTPDFLAIDPSDLTMTDAHRLLLHCVAPRPIAFTSTLSPEGIPNLAPYSYFMAGGANPLSVAISPLTGRGGEMKDTLLNIQRTREYVINVVTYEMRERMNRAAHEYPYGVSEWSDAGFTPAPCVKVKPARVLESPLVLECRLFEIVRHGSGHLSANYIIGEVVYFHVSKALMPAGVLDATLVDYIGRMGGDFYCRANAASMFEMPRPPQAPKSSQAG